jgi:hypothetical protein
MDDFAGFRSSFDRRAAVPKLQTSARFIRPNGIPLGGRLRVVSLFLLSLHLMTLLFRKLIPTLKDYIVHADLSHEKSLNALKTLGYLMEFIVRSKECHARCVNLVLRLY